MIFGAHRRITFRSSFNYFGHAEVGLFRIRRLLENRIRDVASRTVSSRNSAPGFAAPCSTCAIGSTEDTSSCFNLSMYVRIASSCSPESFHLGFAQFEVRQLGDVQHIFTADLHGLWWEEAPRMNGM